MAGIAGSAVTGVGEGYPCRLVKSADEFVPNRYISKVWVNFLGFISFFLVEFAYQLRFWAAGCALETKRRED